VPATVGLGQADATSSLQNAGFLTAIETRPDATAAPGTVLASMPAHDAIVRLGATVTLTVAGPVATPTSTPTPVPSPSGTPSGTPTPVPAG
jgi:beta-lactam-binding protein with PASTA domain